MFLKGIDYFIAMCCICLLVSCNRDKQTLGVFQNVEILSVDDSSKDDSLFLDSIEIVPLETEEHTLMKGFSNFQYLKEQKKFVIIDDRQYVFLFDESGRYISSSNACRGEGPHDYLMAIDAAFNPYSNKVEIYSPAGQGIIHCYDESFNWVENKMLSKENGFTAMKMDVLDEHAYAFEPVREDEEDFNIYVWDSSLDSRSSWKNQALLSDGYVATLTMMQKAFFRCGTTLYYSPYYLDYHFYEYDRNRGSFIPLYELDLGEQVTREDLDKALANRLDSPDYLWEKCEYLLESDYLLPIIRMMNDSFVYACCIRQRKTHHLIHNRQTKQTYFLSPKASLCMHRCYALQDSVLVTILFPYELARYVNEESKKYMSKVTLQRLESIHDEDNPVILKYHLKGNLPTND